MQERGSGESKRRKKSVKGVLIPGYCCGPVGLTLSGDPLRNGIDCPPGPQIVPLKNQRLEAFSTDVPFLQ